MISSETMAGVQDKKRSKLLGATFLSRTLPNMGTVVIK